MTMMAEIYDEMEADGTANRPEPWDRYPVVRDGEEAWVKRDALTEQERYEIADQFERLAQKSHAEADALRIYSRCKKAGITRVIDGGGSAD